MASADDKTIVVQETSPRVLLSALNNLPPIPDVSKYFSIASAKVVAVLTVVGFVIYHTVLLESYGSDSCIWLLSDGRFQGSMWQPYGCMMHTYTHSDTRTCMNYISYWKGRNHIVFMGNSRMEELYQEMKFMVQGTSVDGVSAAPPNELHLLCSQNVDGESNECDAENILLKLEYRRFASIDEKYKENIKSWAGDKTNPPTLIVTGVPLSTTFGTIDKSNSLWNETAEHLMRLASQGIMVMWNLLDPAFERVPKNGTSNETINKRIDEYNHAALTTFKDSSVLLWTSSRLIAQIFQKNASFPNQTQHQQLDTQILLNYLCNDNMYYPDGTCCTTTERPTVVQLIVAVVFGVCGSVSLVMFIACRRDVKVRRQKKQQADGKSEDVDCERKIAPTKTVIVFELLKGFGILGLIAGYAFLCDRTTFFMKENKNYAQVNFFFPLAYVMLLGLFFAKDSQNAGILHRDQTDEWKGWMQLIILIYHYTGASQVLPIYMFIRCLVTAYIFVSAYGHFMYCYNESDYSVRRFVTVLVRYNLLAFVLCLVMNRSYQFYYFVPLISFWFIVLFLTLAVWPRTTHKTLEAKSYSVWPMITKLVILASLITLLYMSEVVFEKIFLFHPIKPLFVGKDNTIHEWWFRWKLDRYTCLSGMVFGLLVCLAKKHRFIDDSTNESTLFRNEVVAVVSVILSFAGFVGYTIMVMACGTKETCNQIHPYVSFVPILGYIVLRNIIGPIRCLYSPFFAWFGKFSLELFISQYHIWLAADTHGVLVLVPTYPVLNVAVTTFIFVFAAHQLHVTTQSLAVHLVPQHWKFLLLNFIVYLGVMIPVAIYSGSFNI